MKDYFYLIEIQYLGFRYHGWQKQPNANTVQRMVERTLNYVLGHEKFKVLAAGRTDAMVSANQSFFELFLKEEKDTSQLFRDLNSYLPADIRVQNVEEVGADFNVIQHSKMKEYIYLFAFGEKNHPFAAPFMYCLPEELDIDEMKKGSKLFCGKHNFQNYCYKPSEKTVFEREVIVSEIFVNDILTANFFPEESYAFKVKGKGFMRHQVRLMMGSLLSLGKGEIKLEDIQKSLTEERGEPLNYIAPASGLMLNQVVFEK